MTALAKLTRLVALVALFALGCGKGGKVEDFTPPADNARKALEAALAHWQAGNPPGGVTGASPAVEVLDSKWKSGAKLTGYEIVKEEPGPGPRTFTVRLTYAKGPAEDARYVVSGIDPLWVYREEDYKKLSGAGM
jgi:hypothetical protein